MKPQMMPNPCLHFLLSPFVFLVFFFGHHLIYSNTVFHHHDHSESAPRLVYILIKTGARAVLAIPTTGLALELAPKNTSETSEQNIALHYALSSDSTLESWKR